VLHDNEKVPDFAQRLSLTIPRPTTARHAALTTPFTPSSLVHDVRGRVSRSRVYYGTLSPREIAIWAIVEARFHFLHYIIQSVTERLTSCRRFNVKRFREKLLEATDRNNDQIKKELNYKIINHILRNIFKNVS